MIEGRVVHRMPNALQIMFRTGPDDPLAVGVQGAGNSVFARMAIRFGFGTSGVGIHRIAYADGSVVWVESKKTDPTVLTRGDGTRLGMIHRARTSTAIGATAGTLFHFVPDPDEAVTSDLFRLRVLDRMGEEFARLDVVRDVGGWSSGRMPDDRYEASLWWDHTGRPLPVPILGTRLWTRHALDAVERDVLLGACVDIALGLRPYITAMTWSDSPDL